MKEYFRNYTFFVTNSGQHVFLYVPIRISNSPAVFSRFILVVLGDLMQDGTCIAYMNDLIVHDNGKGIQKLRRVLERAC